MKYRGNAKTNEAIKIYQDKFGIKLSEIKYSNLKILIAETAIQIENNK